MKPTLAMAYNIMKRRPSGSTRPSESMEDKMEIPGKSVAQSIMERKKAAQAPTPEEEFMDDDFDIAESSDLDSTSDAGESVPEENPRRKRLDRIFSGR